MRTQRAFTLLELLVVIGLIALLLGLLVPALAGVRRSATATKCLTQLRNLQTAHFAYLSDHDGRFIDANLPHGAPLDEEVAWINTLSEYFGDDPVSLRSPLDDSPHWPESQGGSGSQPIQGTSDRFRRTSYGVNNYLTRHAPDTAYRRLTQVPNPASTVHFVIMAYEGPFAGADHLHVENWWINDALPDAPPALANEMVQINAVKGRFVESPDDAGHGWTSVSNYGFLDGHVDSLQFAEVYSSPTNNHFDPDVARRIGVAAP